MSKVNEYAPLQASGDETGNPVLPNGHEQYLSFLLNNEEYGVEILRVQEIKGWDRVTPVPNSPDCVRGVINLRGAIVPVIDLRRFLGMPALEYGPTTVVIVLRITSGRGERIMGMVVDSVFDVYAIPDTDRQALPAEFDADVMMWVKNLATVDGNMVILLDIDRVFNSSELAVLDDRQSGDLIKSRAPE